MKLIARKSFRYNTRRLMAGEEFEAKDKYVAALVGARLARHAEAATPAPAAPPKPVGPDIDELRAEAERLGVDVDGRWGVNRLQQEIAQAKL